MILAPVRLTWPHVLVSTEVECVARCRRTGEAMILVDAAIRLLASGISER
jgi:hypothetical protein